ncbi:hypothetical protein [Coleofasciculus sp.]|uniref:hypothetical protein n=1 Tax=Coleofasciculus sp. TaxID=3100458 RepID=UPI0039FAD87E
MQLSLFPETQTSKAKDKSDLSILWAHAMRPYGFLSSGGYGAVDAVECVGVQFDRFPVCQVAIASGVCIR